ncbi:MAG: GLUG motif-containing protein [Sedimentisphaerales bacterium]
MAINFIHSYLKETKMFTAPKPTPALCLQQTIILSIFLLVANFASAYSGGDGSPNNPYQIADVNDLLYLGSDEPNYDKFFILTADINLAPNLPGRQIFNNAVIAPGDYPSGFTGSFDGACHKISNLTINADPNIYGCLGLFGVVGGKINNLGLEDVNIIGGNDLGNVGGLVGGNDNGTISNCYSKGNIYVGITAHNVGGLVGSNGGDINNCYSKGIIAVAGTESYIYPGASNFGGLVGENVSEYFITGAISNSYSSCDVICGKNVGNIGGLVGLNGTTFPFCQVTNCYSAGTVSVENGSSIGGLVGSNWAGINSCFSTSSVIVLGSSSSIGGLVGDSSWGDINNCYSTGDVNGGDYSSKIGGLVGLVGINYGSVITNCYSTGNVSGGINDIGGLIGAIYLGTVTASFWDVNTSGLTFSAGGTGKTTAEMKTESTFTNASWDFVNETVNGTDDIWSIKEDVNYPVLVWPLVNLVIPSQFGWYKVNFIDFAAMANWWKHRDCAVNNDCGGADFDFSGTIDMADLEIFCRYWLAGTTD